VQERSAGEYKEVEMGMVKWKRGGKKCRRGEEKSAGEHGEIKVGVVGMEEGGEKWRRAGDRWQKVEEK
jgi:hypothetical protein